jgi:hypothetical protein
VVELGHDLGGSSQGHPAADNGWAHIRRRRRSRRNPGLREPAAGLVGRRIRKMVFEEVCGVGVLVAGCFASGGTSFPDLKPSRMGQVRHRQDLLPTVRPVAMSCTRDFLLLPLSSHLILPKQVRRYGTMYGR